MMKRNEIRKLKRAAARDQDVEAMQLLLRRSVLFGHKRLALLRCLQAELMGIEIERDVLAYCQRVAESCTQEEIHRLLRHAAGNAVTAKRSVP